MQYYYLLILAFTLSYPLFKSFETKIQFYKKWYALMPAITIAAVLFIAWDIWFTSMGMWYFNHNYVTGMFLVNLPIEEWLFFFITPFSCVFIYEVLNYFIKQNVFAKSSKLISSILIIGLFAIAFLNIEKMYTAFTFIALASFLIYHQFINKSAYLPRFYLTWLICMIPFLIVNGLLTAIPIITYNKLHILNIRIYTIPIEDMFYGMLNILLVISIYEYLKQRKK
ncbi:MAG: lycopene cyclase domain-containing protein [Bacteroidetes bacterium]|nr:lycopene cyclase domain-containing protein [Bacteroidota bacterium]